MPRAKRNLKVKRPSKVVSMAGIAGAFFGVIDQPIGGECIAAKYGAVSGQPG